MRFSRLFSASLLVAAVTVLGSCGETTTPTTPSATDPSLLGVREFTISPNPVSWTKMPEDTLPTDTRTVMIGGVIAVASYPTFGPPVYTSSIPIEAAPTTAGPVPNNWLEFTYGASASSFSKAPLGWNVSFKLKPAAALLPIGSYTATIAVNVPAALNNPQMLTVTFNNCGNCLFVGDTRYSALTEDSPWWDRGSHYHNDNGSYDAYGDWRVFIPPYTTAYVYMESDCVVDGGFYDTYLYAWTLPVFEGKNRYTSNDDFDDCNNSRITLINNNSEQQEFLVRATTFDGGDLGNYRMRVTLEDYYWWAVRTAVPGAKQVTKSKD